MVGVGFFLVVWYALPWGMSVPVNLEGEAATGARILDRHGDMIAVMGGEDYYRCLPLKENEVPSVFANALMAAEDKRFMQHGGIDFLRLIRATAENLTGSQGISGASTITQQLIKVSSPPAPRTLSTKLREILTARQIEMRWSKERILMEYINRVDFGNLCRGAEFAAWYYFGKSLSALSLAENAMIAGLPINPTHLNPRINPDHTLQRRNIVLERMRHCGFATNDSIIRAKAEPLFSHSSHPRLEPVMPNVVSRIIQGKSTGTVKTTIDSQLQFTVMKIVSECLFNLKENNVGQSAVMVIHNSTGEILCSVGSARRDDAQGGLFDGTRLPRSAGSTLKPFVYALAFQAGATPSTIVADIPMVMQTDSGAKAPSNYNNTFLGPLPMRQALACSQNIPAITTMQRYGGEAGFLKMLNSLGFSGIERTAAHYGLGLSIGNAEVTLYDLAKAYRCLARGGILDPITMFSTTAQNQAGGNRVLPEDVCYMISDILSDPIARVRVFGYGGTFNFPFKCALKTGTSSDYRDNWCVGYTQEFTVAVWVGNFNNQSMRQVSGIVGAGPIFASVMKHLHQDCPATFLTCPQGVVSHTVDIRTGHIISPEHSFAPPVSKEYQAEDLFCKHSQIIPAKQADYAPDGRVILDPIYKSWLQSSHNTAATPYSINEESLQDIPLQIVSPRDGTTIVLDPELPHSGQRLRLCINKDTPCRWTCSTLAIFFIGADTFVTLALGEHVLTATDGTTQINVKISVKSL